MITLGYMEKPAGFPYLDVYLKGKPVHRDADPFLLRHPMMDCSRRAKIFNPFAALKGFEEAIDAKNVIYIDRPELSDDQKYEISRRLNILHRLTLNSKKARISQAIIYVDFFVPCTDPDSSAYGQKGRKMTVRGICRQVDGSVSRTITVGSRVIPFRDLLAIEASGLFDSDA